MIRNSLISFLIGLGLSAVFAFSSCAPKETPDCGFVQNVYGQRISWKNNMPIEFVITAGVPQELRSAVYRAAATWQKNLGRKVFEITEESLQDSLVSSQPSRDRKNAIYFYEIGSLIKSPNRAELRFTGLVMKFKKLTLKSIFMISLTTMKISSRLFQQD